MPPDDDRWVDWGKRFRQLIREQQKTLAIISEAMNQAESTLRSWTNGTREINLSDFFRLCKAAGVPPAQVLFGRIGLTDEQKAQLGSLVVGILDSDAASSPYYPGMIKTLSRDLKHRRKKP